MRRHPYKKGSKHKDRCTFSQKKRIKDLLRRKQKVAHKTHQSSEDEITESTKKQHRKKRIEKKAKREKSEKKEKKRKQRKKKKRNDVAHDSSGNDGDLDDNSSCPSGKESEVLGLELMAKSKGGGVKMLQYRESGRTNISVKIDRTSAQITWTKLDDHPDEQSSEEESDVEHEELEDNDPVNTSGSFLIKDQISVKQGKNTSILKAFPDHIVDPQTCVSLILPEFTLDLQTMSPKQMEFWLKELFEVQSQLIQAQTEEKQKGEY